MTAELTALQPGDRDVVAAWLRDFLRVHLHLWRNAYALEPWSSEELDAHIAAHRLVARDLDEMYASIDDDDACLRVARSTHGAPLGLVYAHKGRDRYLQIEIGVLAWLYVAPRCRGQGLASMLMAEANAWFEDHDLVGAEVFVTQANASAAATYARAGFVGVDMRMLRASR